MQNLEDEIKSKQGHEEDFKDVRSKLSYVTLSFVTTKEFHYQPRNTLQVHWARSLFNKVLHKTAFVEPHTS